MVEYSSNDCLEEAGTGTGAHAPAAVLVIERHFRIFHDASLEQPYRCHEAVNQLLVFSAESPQELEVRDVLK